MIIIYHHKSKVTRVASTTSNDFSNQINQNVASALLSIADKFENEILVWCHENQKDNLNMEAIETLFHHNRFLFSYAPFSENYFDRELGYIEDTPFIKVNKSARYATWQMSSQVGAVHASVVKACKNDLQITSNFDYFLNSFAKRAMVFGLFCYSEPALLKDNSATPKKKPSSLYQLFRFTKQHYRLRWIFLLFFNLLIYERRFPLLPFLSSLFYKKRSFKSEYIDSITLNSNKKIIEKGTIDILIPTIGRKPYLLDVLHNLASQTHLPVNVIIVEQNPVAESTSELDYIDNVNWPFKIKHHFTHQSGACNARNIALDLVESEFVFFADDDIVFENDLIEKVMHNFQLTGNEVLLVAIHLENEKIVPQSPKQFVAFGTCHAFVKSASMKGLKFNMALEFGYGEDADFGMQLKHRGFDFLYLSTFAILHLKAPMGGFRTKPKLQWDDDVIQPKPSPTVMLFKQLYFTNEQILSYKLTVFLKNLNKSFFRNPFQYIKIFNEKWSRSQYWANELNRE